MATGEVEETPPKFYATGPFCLLGLMHGHWKYPLGDIAKSFPVLKDALEDGVHSGVAVVVPARKIAEILDHPDLVQFRKIGDERLRQTQIQDAPTPSRDSAANKPNSQKTTPRKGEPIEIPIPTEQEVLDVFKKVTRKREKKS